MYDKSWLLLDVSKVVKEATMSGMVGPYVKPFMVPADIEPNPDKKKKNVILSGESKKESSKIWKYKKHR